jgi:hypothetical protein
MYRYMVVSLRSNRELNVCLLSCTAALRKIMEEVFRFTAVALLGTDVPYCKASWFSCRAKCKLCGYHLQLMNEAENVAAF